MGETYPYASAVLATCLSSCSFLAASRSAAFFMARRDRLCAYGGVVRANERASLGRVAQRCACTMSLQNKCALWQE